MTEIQNSISANVLPYGRTGPLPSGAVVTPAPYTEDISRKRKLEIDPSAAFLEQLRQLQLTSSIEERGDVIALSKFFSCCQEKFGKGTDLMWYAFFIGATIREPKYLLQFQINLAKLSAECAPIDIHECLANIDVKFEKNEECFVPQLARRYANPKNVYDSWNVGRVFMQMGKLRTTFDGTLHGESAFDDLAKDISKWGIHFVHAIFTDVPSCPCYLYGRSFSILFRIESMCPICVPERH